MNDLDRYDEPRKIGNNRTSVINENVVSDSIVPRLQVYVRLNVATKRRT